MYGRRSLSRVFGFIGCAWCLLDSVPSLAAYNWNPQNVTILSRPTSTAISGNYIEANVSARYTHMPGRHRFYTKLPVAVAKSTLRVGALSALARGVPYPGLQVAIAAVGFVLSQNDGVYEIEKPDNTQPKLDEQLENYTIETTGVYWYAFNQADRFPSPAAAISGALSDRGPDYCATYVKYNPDLDAVGRLVYNITRCEDGAPINTSATIKSRNLSSGQDYNKDNYEPPSGYVPVDEQDLSQLDDHIPPELLSQMYDRDGNIVDIPPWEEQISVMGMSSAETNGNTAPEVMSKAKEWSQNLAAKLEGEPEPNPDTDVDSKTAEEASYEQSVEDRTEPIPPFSEPEIDWQVEEISDMPSWSSGIGAGSCPAPVEFSMSGQTVSFDYEPVCRAAIAVNPFFLGFCTLMALYIVLGRQRAGG